MWAFQKTAFVDGVGSIKNGNFHPVKTLFGESV